MTEITRRLIFGITVLCLFAFLIGGCGTDESVSNREAVSSDESLTVSAAVSLRDAFNEIGELYKSKTGKTVSFNFGASGALQRQIETGAPVDVFASAGEKQMNELAEKNLLDAATRRDFARNRLVLIVPANSKAAIADFADLTKTEIGKIAVGNPKTVPAGEYSEQVFDNLKLKEAIRSKLILAEDVRQVLDYVARGETDAGVVYESDARVARSKVRVAATAPESSHRSILYPIALINDSKNKPAARDFVDLVLSAEGQRILQKYGFAAAS
ncbi:MAG TPA: molybdate ABC transporter substrate-binding protein [Pyrinomonadaceae bacterium]|jgi:molybdate transport system substrate-binding protein